MKKQKFVFQLSFIFFVNEVPDWLASWQQAIEGPNLIDYLLNNDLY